MSDYVLYFIVGGLVFLLFFILLYIGIQKLKRIFAKKEKDKQVSSFLCLDGDKVRSKGELIIDNHLHRLGIKHVYEKTIKVHGKPIKYDWFLPDHDIYIEYWGYYGKAYHKRKQEKLKLYKQGKLSLISIENLMFSDIYSHLEAELNKHVKLKQLKNVSKHCPNCGEDLDERF